VHTLGLGQLPLPFGPQGPDGWGPRVLTPTRIAEKTVPGQPPRPQSQRSVPTGDLRAYETREVTIPPRCGVADPKTQGE
jgi:hypothetical protein